MRLRLVVVSVVCLKVISGFGEIRHVPAEYSTIQSAINAAVHGDTVLVAPGVYRENINFRGRNIVVGSEYLRERNPAHIAATIIDGSQPAHPDTGSCVLLISGEDSSAVLAGFTLTGGTGTPLRDQANGLTYVEGGGILIENSSPVIRDNWIRDNAATRRPAGITSSGGGGIRAGFGRPRIEHNVIMRNSGRYGGGIVINFAVAVIRNNVICQNTGGQDYGGSGLWLYGATEPTLVDNNTIVANTSTLTGGGVRAWQNPLTARNNIVWGNRATSGQPQIDGSTANVLFTYSCVQGGRSGIGNLEADPEFADSNLALLPASPCINAGNPDPAFNDPDGSRGDIGVTGGPLAAAFPPFSAPAILLPQTLINFGAGRPDSAITRAVPVRNGGTARLHLDSVRVNAAAAAIVEIGAVPDEIVLFAADTIYVTWNVSDNRALNDSLFIYHDDPAAPQPTLALLRGTVSSDAAERPAETPNEYYLAPNFPNPFNAVTGIRFDLPKADAVLLQVFDVQGRLLTTLVEDTLPAGHHEVFWNAAGAPSGTYFCRLRAGTFHSRRAMMLIR